MLWRFQMINNVLQLTSRNNGHKISKEDFIFTKKWNELSNFFDQEQKKLDKKSAKIISGGHNGK